MSNFIYEFSSIKKRISFDLEPKTYTKEEVEEFLRVSFKELDKQILKFLERSNNEI